MKNLISVSSVMLLVILGCSCGGSPVTLEGEVASVAIRTGKPVISNLNNPVMNAGVEGASSSVVIELKSVTTAEYHISLPKVLEIQGFTDLKAKSQSMGGLLILTDLKQRLTGKHVEFTCTKAGKEDDVQIYAISELQVRQ